MTHSKRDVSPAHESEREAASEWLEHEHVNEPARAAAERLLESAGTPDQAKHVIDVVHNQAPDHATRHDALASHAGFTSFLELVSASIRPAEHDLWYIVPLPNGRWMTWNESTLDASDWDSRSAAENWIQQSAPRP